MSVLQKQLILDELSDRNYFKQLKLIYSMKAVFILITLTLLLSPFISAQVESDKSIGEAVKDFDLEQTLTIPEKLQPFFKVILGSEENIVLVVLIVSITYWIAILVLIATILKLFKPLQKHPIIRWTLAIVINSIIGIGGVIVMVTEFILYLVNFFDIIKHPIFGVLLAMAISIFIVIGLIILINHLNKSVRKEKASQEGRSLARLLNIAKTSSDFS